MIIPSIWKNNPHVPVTTNQKMVRKSQGSGEIPPKSLNIMEHQEMFQTTNQIWILAALGQPPFGSHAMPGVSNNKAPKDSQGKFWQPAGLGLAEKMEDESQDFMGKP